MDFRQLEAFCAIAEWGNFSEAAKHLYLTQPTISNHIRVLEASLNTHLIERTTKSVDLTEDGKRFYQYAKSLLRLREKAVREFHKTADNLIPLGASSIPSAYLLPEVLAAYREKEPDVLFDVIHGDSQNILERLQSGSLDIGITGSPVSDGHFSCKPIYRDEMVLVTPATPYFQKQKAKQAPLKQLLEEPFLMREDGSGTRRETEAFLKTLGMDSSSLRIAARMNDLESIKQSIIYGLGVSILSKKVTKDLERDNRTLSFPLSSGGIYRSYYLIYRKSKLQDTQLGNFIPFLEQFFL